MRKIRFFLPIFFFVFHTVPIQVSIAQTPSALGISAENIQTNTANEDPLQILATTSDTLTARFTLPEIQVRKRQQTADATESSEIYFAGADWTLDVGKPRLPIHTQRLGIPIVGTPIVTIIQARPEIRTVENIRITPDDPIFPSPTTNSRPDASVAQGFYPTQLVEAIPIGFVRDQRIASLQINPIQYNSATKQLKIFKSVTFRIDFPTFSATSGTPGKRTFAGKTVSAAPSTLSRKSPAFESLFQGTLRNYDQAKPWRSQRQMPYGGIAPRAPTLTTSTLRFKIPITRTDLYRITYNNIKASGIAPEDIDLDTVRLDSSGQKQGIYIFDENENNTLDANEQIVFYGRTC